METSNPNIEESKEKKITLLIDDPVLGKPIPATHYLYNKANIYTPEDSEYNDLFKLIFYVMLTESYLNYKEEKPNEETNKS